MNANIDRAAALAGFGIEHATILSVDIGLINSTYLVTHNGAKFILQRVNPMFSAAVHEDINAVTCHLRSKNLITPRLIPTADGCLFLLRDGQTWRLYSFIDGDSFDKVEDPAIARGAGLILAEFHRALLDLDHEFRNIRTDVHDTPRHLQILRTALHSKQDHAHYKAILPLATEILDYAGRLPMITPCPERRVHGDPKINNFLFDQTSRRCLCLIDFDTLSNMPLALELGDALRSWCNPGGEDVHESTFSISHFEAALQGYVSNSRDFILEAEWRSFIASTHIIYVELAARFCADALNESFFGWDPDRFPSHSRHNQMRAQSQINALKSFLSQIDDANKVLNAVFA